MDGNTTAKTNRASRRHGRERLQRKKKVQWERKNLVIAQPKVWGQNKLKRHSRSCTAAVFRRRVSARHGVSAGWTKPTLNVTGPGARHQPTRAEPIQLKPTNIPWATTLCACQDVCAGTLINLGSQPKDPIKNKNNMQHHLQPLTNPERNEEPAKPQFSSGPGVARFQPQLWTKDQQVT